MHLCKCTESCERGGDRESGRQKCHSSFNLHVKLYFAFFRISKKRLQIIFLARVDASGCTWVRVYMWGRVHCRLMLTTLHTIVNGDNSSGECNCLMHEVKESGCFFVLYSQLACLRWIGEDKSHSRSTVNSVLCISTFFHSIRDESSSHSPVRGLQPLQEQKKHDCYILIASPEIEASENVDWKRMHDDTSNVWLMNHMQAQQSRDAEYKWQRKA